MGFPTRNSRNDFGPTYKEAYPVRDPSTEIGQAIYNKTFWNLSGLGRVSQLGLWRCTIDSGVVTTVEQSLAWDSNAALSNIVFTYEARGWYSFQLASSYPDEQGNSISTALTHGIAAVSQDSRGTGTHDGGDGQALLTDSGAAWTPSAFVGGVVYNLTDGSKGTITANTATTITAILAGGTEDDWDDDEQYLITSGAARGLVQFSNGYTGAVYFFDGSGNTVDPNGFSLVVF